VPQQKTDEFPNGYLREIAAYVRQNAVLLLGAVFGMFRAIKEPAGHGGLYRIANLTNNPSYGHNSQRL
jgi:hypothetical protein